MIILQGTLLNVMQTPKGTRKDGTEYGGDWRVQIQHDNLMKNNQRVVELVNFAVDNPDDFKPYIGEQISIPVSPWANGGVNYQILPGYSPKVHKSNQRVSA